jgi:hypothetical protein
MAANLRAKIPKDDILLINDKNLDATSRFMQEHGSSGTSTKSLAIEVVESVRKVAERSVSVDSPIIHHASIPPYDEYVP